MEVDGGRDIVWKFPTCAVAEVELPPIELEELILQPLSPQRRTR